MPQKIREVMTSDPEVLNENATVREAAVCMKEQNIGDILVVDAQGQLAGIVTDRDVVVRCIADKKDPDSTSVRDIASRDVVKLSEDDNVDNAIELMRRKSIRRIPVVDDGRPVGVVSLGDLSEERDPQSVLGQISAAPPNH
jgi:CBS domain-containing protein